MSVNAKNNVSASSTASELIDFSGVSKGMFGIVISILLFAGCFIAAFVSMSNFTGSKDDWNQIKPQITKIWILVLIGVFGLTIAALLYFVQDPAKTMYFMIVMVCLSFGLSFSALSVAAITR